ncbi:MAG TPA: DUF2283 domain-containing protein, partial [Nitrospirae bacterium]|nr:DUF2283 domain-containing protein [Nitrospirota bacterium]
DPERDLMYIYFKGTDIKVARTETITPGVHADFDRDGRLLGLEVIDASEMLDKKIEFNLPEKVAVS